MDAVHLLLERQLDHRVDLELLAVRVRRTVPEIVERPLARLLQASCVLRRLHELGRDRAPHLPADLPHVHLDAVPPARGAALLQRIAALRLRLRQHLGGIVDVAAPREVHHQVRKAVLFQEPARRFPVVRAAQPPRGVAPDKPPLARARRHGARCRHHPLLLRALRHEPRLEPGPHARQQPFDLVQQFLLT